MSASCCEAFVGDRTRRRDLKTFTSRKEEERNGSIRGRETAIRGGPGRGSNAGFEARRGFGQASRGDEQADSTAKPRGAGAVWGLGVSHGAEGPSQGLRSTAVGAVGEGPAGEGVGVAGHGHLRIFCP